MNFSCSLRDNNDKFEIFLSEMPPITMETQLGFDTEHIPRCEIR